VIDAGPTRGGPPSTIVDVAEGRARLIRPGAVPWDRVLEALTRSEPST
jgi:tRNA A37 threonylcarbamoyladenosine synthetase subunit TsaC/SUA5/YrdC